MPCVSACRALATKDNTAGDAELVKIAAQINELKKEVDVRVAAFLKEEEIGQDKVALYNVLRQEVRSRRSCSAHYKIKLSQAVWLSRQYMRCHL